MIDDLEIDPAYRVIHKRAIIARMVVTSRSRSPVVFCTGFDRGLVEFVDQLVGYVLSLVSQP